MANADITLRATVSGLSGGVTELVNLSVSNSSSPAFNVRSQLTTASQTNIFGNVPSSCRFLIVYPEASSNTFNFRVRASTAELGLPIAADGFVVIGIDAQTNALSVFASSTASSASFFVIAEAW